MKLFKLKTRKQTGYSTISEPISDLDPKVKAAIKSKTPTNGAKNKGLSVIHDLPTTPSPTKPFGSSSDDIAETVILTPSPSETSGSRKHFRDGSSSSSEMTNNQASPSEKGRPITPSKQRQSLISLASKKSLSSSTKITDDDVDDDDDQNQSEKDKDEANQPQQDSDTDTRQSVKISASLKDTNPLSQSGAKSVASRQQFTSSAKSLDLVTEAPTEHMNLFHLKETSSKTKARGGETTDGGDSKTGDKKSMKERGGGGGGDQQQQKQPQHSQDKRRESHLDHSFDPEIISVISDITEPTYGTRHTNDVGCQNQWRKFAKGKLNMSDFVGESVESPATFLDLVMDAICSHPRKNGKRSTRSSRRRK